MQRKVTKEEKVIRLLEYLKKYTDRYHPASIPMIERYFTKNYGERFFGDKNTRKNLIKTVTRVLNSDRYGDMLPKDQWRINYDAFERDFDEPGKYNDHHICNIYYNQEFCESDIRLLLDSIAKNPDLSVEDKKRLRDKIMKHLVNDCFGKIPLTPAQRNQAAWYTARNSYGVYQAFQRKVRAAEEGWWD